MITYRIIYDAVQDAYNWYSAIVKFKQSSKLKDQPDIDIADQIQNPNFDRLMNYGAREVKLFEKELGDGGR